MDDFKRTHSESKKTVDQQKVKVMNQHLLLRLIHQNAPLSRADLTARTHLSPTTISSLVEGLIKRGLVIEKGTAKTGASGRRPIMLEINPTGAYVISAELLYSDLNIALYDLQYHEVKRHIVPVDDYNRVGLILIQTIEQLIAETGVQEQKLWGICMGVPGMIDLERGVIFKSTVLPVGPDNHFYSIVRDRFRSAVVMLENESSLCAYAEKEVQVKAGLSNLIYMDINIGIGAGIILDGRLYRGADGLAGEIGHMTVDLHGPKCLCGNRGCLERMASVPALIQRVVFGMMSGRKTLVNDMTQGDYNLISIPVLRDAALAQDALVLEAIDETALTLAASIISVLNLLNLQAVVLGGKITELGDILIDRINAYVAQNALISSAEVSKRLIYCSQIGENAATLGGAQLLLDNLIHAIDLMP